MHPLSKHCSEFYKNIYEQLKYFYGQVILRRQKNGCNRRLINCDNLAKESWKVINEHRNPKGVMGIPEIRNAAGMRILGAQGLADGFANFFSDLPPCNAQLENIHLNIREDPFFVSPCSKKEVFGVIQRTSKKSSPGIDGSRGIGTIILSHK
ncbi:hypothetical protein HHI36_016859 [Cryptolaemus montrouzieri]|uniref:Uncharacterized protein n=1 Tax=Cryptolaemus montrouzieri TaxID=559131 RepID=A0ABD2NL02_9CUCU